MMWGRSATSGWRRNMAVMDHCRVSRRSGLPSVLVLVVTCGSAWSPAARADATAPPAVLRRMTAFEYKNSVRDLLHVDPEPLDRILAPDESAGLFVSNATAPVDRLTV